MEYQERIKNLRNKRGYSQYYMANKLKIEQPQYWRYEKGENEIPIRYLIEISKILETTTDYLLGLEEECDSLTYSEIEDIIAYAREQDHIRWTQEEILNEIFYNAISNKRK